jgi:hypothetical protein
MLKYISPHFTEEKLNNPSLDDLIDIFEDRIRYWVFEPAKILFQNPMWHASGFCLLLTYFEGIWVYMQGCKSDRLSRKFFKDAFVDVFKHTQPQKKEELLSRVANVIYEDARCGFFHDGMFRDHILFWPKGPVLTVTLPKKNGQLVESGEIKSIIICVDEFLIAIERHFASFLSRLRDSSQTKQRCKFERICQDKWKWNEVMPVGLTDPTSLIK